MAQESFVLPDGKSTKIKFELINNLIVFPLELNGVELSFLLDTGVSKPILFNLPTNEAVEVNHVETTNLRGLGGGETIAALRSENNILKIGTAINRAQDIYVIFDESINFAPRLGITVHGIIGYDLFKDFIVELNYGSKYIKLHQPSDYKMKHCKKCELLPLSFHNNKPYITGKVTTTQAEIPVKLLIDSGSSDALWLFTDESLGLLPTNQKFEDFLGKGLSGSVYGYRSKHESFSLKSFMFKDVNVAYPDSTSISYARKHLNRNGSICAEILKRFNFVFDYKNSTIQLKKNRNFKAPFRYNRSGITLEQNGLRVVKEEVYKKSLDTESSNGNNIAFQATSAIKFNLKPSFTVVELRPNSPADRAGVKLGDVVLSINGQPTSNLKLHEVIQNFRDDIGKLIKLKIDRSGQLFSIRFKLEDIFE